MMGRWDRHGVPYRELVMELVREGDVVCCARTWDDGWRGVLFILPDRLSQRWHKIMDRLIEVNKVVARTEPSERG